MNAVVRARSAGARIRRPSRATDKLLSARGRFARRFEIEIEVTFGGHDRNSLLDESLIRSDAACLIAVLARGVCGSRTCFDLLTRLVGPTADRSPDKIRYQLNRLLRRR